jgi:hypothetical protein
MRSSTKVLFLLITFLAQLYLVAQPYAESARIVAKISAPDFALSVAPPQKDHLTLLSVVPVTVGGEVLGGLAAYDDLATARPADYLELYNKEGALLVVTWFDRFGIERLALDRALAENADELEGVFVLVATGDSV